MPDSIIEDMDMNDATTKESKHGRVTHPASRGSYAMDQGLLLEWHVHALEGARTFLTMKVALPMTFLLWITLLQIWRVLRRHQQMG